MLVIAAMGGGKKAVEHIKLVSRGLDGLLPEVRAKVEELQRSLRLKGIDTRVGSTLRVLSEQQALAHAGKSSTGSQSWHLLGRAVDLYPIDPATGKADIHGHNTNLFWRMHQEAKRLGFRGIAFDDKGNKRYITTTKIKDGKPVQVKVWDGGHLEYRGNFSNWALAAADYTKRTGRKIA